MKILEILTPPLHFTHQSLLQAEQIRINLENNLIPKDAKVPIFSLTKKRESYEGEVLENTFVLSRRKEGKDGFPAFASGSIIENQNGSELIVEIKLPKFKQMLVLVFFILLISMISLAIIVRLISLSEKIIYLTTFFSVASAFGFIPNYFNAKSEVKDLKMKIIEFAEGKNKK